MTQVVHLPERCRIPVLVPQLVRHVVMRAFTCHGNLRMVDSIGLTAEAVRHFYFYYRLQPGPLKLADICFWDLMALWNVVRCVPDLAASAGFTPRLVYPGRQTMRSRLWFALRRETEWTENVLHPAWEKYRRSPQPDLTCREGEVFFHSRETDLRSALRHEAIGDIRVVSRVARRNVGERKRKAERQLTGCESADWLHLVRDRVPFEQAFEIGRDGLVKLNGKAVAVGFKDTLGTGTKRRDGELSLDEWIEDKDQKKQALMSEREADPVDLALVREFRDLRDALAQFPLLVGAVEGVESRDGQEVVRAEVDYLRRLLGLLRETADPALRAAIVYESSRRGGRDHGAVSRVEAASAYGVTPRQVERKGDAARAMLGRLAG